MEILFEDFQKNYVKIAMLTPFKGGTVLMESETLRNICSVYKNAEGQEFWHTSKLRST